MLKIMHRKIVEENIDFFNGITIDGTGGYSFTCSWASLADISINNITTDEQINASLANLVVAEN